MTILTIKQIAAARAWLGWYDARLAQKSNVSEASLAFIRAGRMKISSNLTSRLVESFEKEGLFFTTERGKSGVGLKASADADISGPYSPMPMNQLNGRQVAAAKKALSWSNKSLAAHAHASFSTVKMLNNSMTEHTIIKLRKAFETAGVEFLKNVAGDCTLILFKDDRLEERAVQYYDSVLTILSRYEKLSVANVETVQLIAKLKKDCLEQKPSRWVGRQLGALQAILVNSSYTSWALEEKYNKHLLEAFEQ